MIADFKVFHVGMQKALNIKTCSCDWIGKPITGAKKNNKKKTNKLSKKQKPNKQNKNKTKKKQRKEPPQVWWCFKTFGILWDYFLFLLFILTKQLYFIQMRIWVLFKNSVWNLSDYLGIKSVYNLIHIMHTYTLHDEYTIHKYVCYI